MSNGGILENETSTMKINQTPVKRIRYVIFSQIPDDPAKLCLLEIIQRNSIRQYFYIDNVIRRLLPDSTSIKKVSRKRNRKCQRDYLTQQPLKTSQGERTPCTTSEQRKRLTYACFDSSACTSFMLSRIRP